MTRLLQDLRQLRTLREQREQKALRHLEKARESLQEAQKACQQQQEVMDALQQNRHQVQASFVLLCECESVAMAQLDQHRMELEILTRKHALAQQELTQRQKVQKLAEVEQQAARQQLLLARKAIDKIDQAKDMVQKIEQEQSQVDLDRQEEEILELYKRLGR
jgi:hypothetical protein